MENVVAFEIAAAVEKYLGTGSIPETWRLLSGLDRIDSDLSGTQHPEAAMKIRCQSKDGPLISPPAGIPAKLSQQVDAVTPQWLEQLHRDPASGARLEVEFHGHFRRPADQMTAGLVAEATIPGAQAEPGKEGTPIGPTPHDAPRRSGG